MIITIYADAGHAWGKVNKALLEKLGIADKISRYSYMRDHKAYLEEDVDLQILFNALDANGYKYRIDDRFSHKTSRIRGYDSYKHEVNKVLYEAIGTPIYRDSIKAAVTFKAFDDRDAWNWIVNHCDTSLAWVFNKVEAV